MLVKTSSVYIYKYSAAIKHGYILRYLLNNPEYEVCSLLNDRSFSVFDRGGDTIQKFFNLFGGLESKIILKKNGINPKNVTILKKVSDIRHDDLVILYNIMCNNFRQMSGINAFKALSLLHFHGRAREDFRIQQAGVNILFNEVNFQKTSEIFRKYYHLSLPWIVLPFVFEDRFKPIKPFKERQNKAFSVGTISYKTHKEFLEIYKNPCVHPVRKFVKDNPEFFATTADCYSEDYQEQGDGLEIKATDIAPIKLYKRIYNRFAIGRQKKYFSFNMVEKFNEYKMHIVGEEITGVPGVGYVEGMACGSAYIGLDSPMYRDLGLIPGVHYIAYDGTKEGLRSTIEYWQRPENQTELERIAETGCKFVRENFCGDKVAHNLIEALKVEQQKWLNSHK
jgi:hypothetical protein